MRELDEFEQADVDFIRNLGLDEYNIRRRRHFELKYNEFDRKYKARNKLMELPKDMQHTRDISAVINEFDKSLRTLKHEMKELIRNYILDVVSEKYLSYLWLMEEEMVQK